MVRGLVSLICTLEYYEILNLRFALENRYENESHIETLATTQGKTRQGLTVLLELSTFGHFAANGHQSRLLVQQTRRFHTSS